MRAEMRRALTAFQEGRHEDVVTAAQTVLADEQDHPGAMHLLGVARLAQGDAAACVELLDRLLTITPEDEDVHNNRSLALRKLGRLDEAEASVRRAVEIDPQGAKYRNNLGTLLDATGRREEAADAFRHAVKLQPDYGAAQYNLGRVLRLLGRTDEAAQSLRRATELDPGLGYAWSELGRALSSQGERRTAVDCFRRALMLHPDDPEILEAMGDAAQRAGALGDAVGTYRRSLQSDPSRPSAWYSLGCAELERGEPANALAALTHGTRLAPDDLHARYQLGKAAFDVGRVEDAVDLMRSVLADAPDDDDVRDHALDSVAKFIPGDGRATPQEILACRREWAERRCPAPAAPTAAPPRDDVLRVGYVSAFFGGRNWMKPVWAVINAHDRARVQVHLWSDGPRAAVGEEYAAHPGDRFHDVTGLSNEQVAERVRAERIDVLVDLNGFSRAERLGLFPLRAAPVGVEWFNCFGPSGVTGIDHVVADAQVLPEGEETGYPGRVWRVSGSSLAFEVGYPVPEVAPPPCLAGDGITFGSLVSAYKLTPTVIATWSAILNRAPEARLLLRNRALGSEDTRSYVRACFGGHGVAADRLLLEGPAPHDAFLRTYDRIDLALDSFPYNGGTTTTEAIWQGVPVLTFAGDRWAGRTSASLERNGGLDAFVADDLESHVADAVGMANDPETPERLRGLRAGLRDQLRAAPVCDAARLATDLEEIYDRVRE